MTLLRFIFSLLILLSLVSCSPSGPALFGKKDLHEQYADKLIKAGLRETALGSLWFSAAEAALAQPVPITLPYRQTGYFAPDAPRAIGLQFTARRGEKLLFSLERKSLGRFTLFADLWRQRPADDPRLLLSVDSVQKEFTHEVDDEETYILRLQPELLSSGEYTLSISVGPSLAFPVSGKVGHIGSIWGDARDAGARRHEGIDIFAPRRTPVVAAADGIVTRVGENNLGGKVLFLRPQGKNMALYYAHLDEQLVTSGQRVKVGDTLGLVGNTGNARTTPPHLHFGIYALGGAIDPYPFVNPDVRRPGNISVSTNNLNKHYRLTREVRDSAASLPRNTVVLVTDASTRGLLARLPVGRTTMVPQNIAQLIENQIVKINIKDTLPLLEAPLASAPQKRRLLPDTPVRVFGYFNNYAYVQTDSALSGWVPRDLL